LAKRQSAPPHLPAQIHHYEGFTARYQVVRLLYGESYDGVHKALAREKQLKEKQWSLAKKITLFERRKLQWKELAARVVSVDAVGRG
jgi:predicted GIY-YIG superfamily endonuclease